MEKVSRLPFSTVVGNYLILAKPGIIFGNGVTAVIGFILASRGVFNIWLFLSMLEGLSLIIAASCVFNNYIDRDIDKMMERTKNRPLARGVILENHAMIYAILLALSGTFILAICTNMLTTFIALFGAVVYVVLYSLLKYHTVYGTLIGSIAGAVPPVVGYCAVTGSMDRAAWILFFMIALWQMPHFFAIAIYRLSDYIKASIPLYPIKKGVFATKIHMALYILAFTATSSLLTALGYMGYAYFGVVILLGLSWLTLSLKGFRCRNDQIWARQMFIFSLVKVMALCIVTPFSVM